MKRKSHEEFVSELFLVKPYLEVLDEYVNSTTKLHFKCKKCGFIFTARPSGIVRDNDCPICNKPYKHTTESFVYKAKIVHNNKYDYSKVDYKSAKEKVCIICPEHGEFWLIAHDHLNGHGCPKCKAVEASIREADSLEDFIRKAKIVHNNKYDYSKVNYINCFTPVTIICPKHGEFLQKPVYHLQGNGCLRCNTSRGEEMIKLYLDSRNIYYKQQFSIKSEIFRNRKRIDVDFFLPDYNVFIEYNGMLHYVAKNHFGGQLTFENQKIRDEDLRKYCKNNNIKLLEISYKYDNLLKITDVLNNYLNN